MPTVCLTGRPVSRETSAVVIVIPALGPSLGIAPAGTWMWNSRSVNAPLGEPELLGVAADVGERDPRRLLHHVAELAGEHEALLAGHRGRLDEEHVAAGAGDREARWRRPGPRCARPPPGRSAGARAPRERPRARSAPAPLALLRGDPGRRLSQQLAELALETAHARLAGVLGDDLAQQLVGDRRPLRRAGRCARSGAATGSRGRSRPSRRSCSRRSGPPPCGRAAAPGSSRRRSPWR